MYRLSASGAWLSRDASVALRCFRYLGHFSFLTYLATSKAGARFAKVESRNFAGHFRVSQVRLYLKNGEDHEVVKLHSHFSFCHLENMLKDGLSRTSGWQFHKWLFEPEKFSGLSRNGP